MKINKIKTPRVIRIENLSSSSNFFPAAYYYVLNLQLWPLRTDLTAMAKCIQLQLQLGSHQATASDG